MRSHVPPWLAAVEVALLVTWLSHVEQFLTLQTRLWRESSYEIRARFEQTQLQKSPHRRAATRPAVRTLDVLTVTTMGDE